MGTYKGMPKLRSFNMLVLLLVWITPTMHQWDADRALDLLMQDRTFILYVSMELWYDAYVHINSGASVGSIQELHNVLFLIDKVLFTKNEQQAADEAIMKFSDLLLQFQGGPNADLLNFDEIDDDK